MCILTLLVLDDIAMLHADDHTFEAWVFPVNEKINNVKSSAHSKNKWKIQT